MRTLCTIVRITVELNGLGPSVGSICSSIGGEMRDTRSGSADGFVDINVSVHSSSRST